MPAWVFWPLLAIGTAFMQGLLLPAVKRTPPGSEARRQGFALHILGTALYLLPLVLAPTGWAAALLSRALLFDVVLNTTQRMHPFGVGYSASTDRLLRWVAPKRPERLRAALWLFTVLLAVGWYFMRR